MIAELEHPHANHKLAERLSQTFGCPVEIVGPAMSSSRLPTEALQKVRQVVVVDEIEEQDPQLFASMKRHKVDAVVPFEVSPNDSMCWALFGTPFVEEVYTPLDFTYLERLFDRIQMGLLENVLPLRSQLEEATGRLSEVKGQLAASWDELEELRRKVEFAEAERYQLSQSAEPYSFHNLPALRWDVPEEIVSGARTIEQFLFDRESVVVSLALK